MNQKLANAAIAGITNPNYEEEPGFCQRFARQCIQSVYHDKYNGFMAASAAQTGRNFRDGGLSVDGPAEIGDVFYKLTGSGPFGHVGIYVGGKVAENSSTHIGRIQGAKGYRSYPGDWGEPQVIVRLEVTPRLILGFAYDEGAAESALSAGSGQSTGMQMHYESVPGAVFDGGTWYADSLRVARLLSADPSGLHGGIGAIRQILDALHIGITAVDTSKMADTSDPRTYIYVQA